MPWNKKRKMLDMSKVLIVFGSDLNFDGQSIGYRFYIMEQMWMTCYSCNCFQKKNDRKRNKKFVSDHVFPNFGLSEEPAMNS